MVKFMELGNPLSVFCSFFLFSGVGRVLGGYKLVDLSGLNKRHPPPSFAVNTIGFLRKTSQNNRIQVMKTPKKDKELSQTLDFVATCRHGR